MNYAPLNKDVNEDKGVAHDLKARFPSFSFCLKHTNHYHCNAVKNISLHIIQEPCVEVLLICFSSFLRELYAKTGAIIARIR